MDKNAFDNRRADDPQGLIDDMLKQSTKQGKKIHEVREKNKELEKTIKTLEKKLKKHEEKSK